MISEDRVEKALEFIRDNSDSMGVARGRVKYLEHKLKVVRSQAFLDSDGNNAVREANALCCGQYESVATEYRDAVTEADTIATRMKAAELTIEVWRTQAANQRRGHM